MTTIAPFNKLPPEILSRILQASFLENPGHSISLFRFARLRILKTCCLVCKGWTDIARSLLYESLELSPKVYCTPWKIIPSLQDYGYLVRSLELMNDSATCRFYGDSDLFLGHKSLHWQSIVSILDLCSDLQKLKLIWATRFPDDEYHELLRKLRDKKGLHTFCCTSVDELFTSHQLDRLFMDVPQLQNIVIDHFYTAHELPAYPQMEALRSLGLLSAEISGDDLCNVLNAVPHLTSLELEICVDDLSNCPTEEEVGRALKQRADSLQAVKLTFIQELPHSPGYPLQEAIASLVRLESFIFECERDIDEISFFRQDVFRLFPPALHVFRTNTIVDGLRLLELGHIFSELQSSDRGNLNLMFHASSTDWHASKDLVLSAAVERGFRITIEERGRAELGQEGSEVILDVVEI